MGCCEHCDEPSHLIMRDKGSDYQLFNDFYLIQLFNLT